MLNLTQLNYKRKKKFVLVAVENSTKDEFFIPHGEKFVLNVTIRITLEDFVKMNKGETCRITYKRHTTYPYFLRDRVAVNHICVIFFLNGIQCQMEIDTGCSSTLISKKQFDLLPNARLIKKGTLQRLRTYSGEVIVPNGVANLRVT